MFPRSGTNLISLSLLLSAISAAGTYHSKISKPRAVIIFKSTSCFSMSLVLSCFRVPHFLFSPVLSLSPLELFISCIKKYSSAIAVYFSTSHYMLDWFHQLNSHKQSNYQMAIIFHHWWSGLHSICLFCDVSGLIINVLKYTALLKLLCAWL